MALGFMQTVSTSFSWGEEKSAAGAASQGTTVDVAVPKGTLDAITAIMTRLSIKP